jgi:hypothetical protein
VTTRGISATLAPSIPSALSLHEVAKTFRAPFPDIQCLKARQTAHVSRADLESSMIARIGAHLAAERGAPRRFPKIGRAGECWNTVRLAPPTFPLANLSVDFQACKTTHEHAPSHTDLGTAARRKRPNSFSPSAFFQTSGLFVLSTELIRGCFYQVFRTRNLRTFRTVAQSTDSNRNPKRKLIARRSSLPRCAVATSSYLLTQLTDWR